MITCLRIVFPDGSWEPVPDWAGERYAERCPLYPGRDCPGCQQACQRTGEPK